MIHINSSNIELFGTPMAIYNLMFVCTVMSAIIFSYFFAKREKLNTTNIFRITAVVFFIVFLGFMNKEMLPKSMLWFMLASMMYFVLLLYYIIAKVFKEDVGTMMCLGSFCVTIAGVFMKLGCFFAGCCYGWKYDGFGAVVYGNQTENPHKGVLLFPIQLVIAVAIALLFVVFLLVYGKIKRGRGHYAVVMTSLTCALLYLMNVLSVAPYNNVRVGGVDIFLTILLICLAIGTIEIVKLVLNNREEKTLYEKNMD